MLSKRGVLTRAEPGRELMLILERMNCYEISLRGAVFENKLLF